MPVRPLNHAERTYLSGLLVEQGCLYTAKPHSTHEVLIQCTRCHARWSLARSDRDSRHIFYLIDHAATHR